MAKDKYIYIKYNNYFFYINLIVKYILNFEKKNGI